MSNRLPKLSDIFNKHTAMPATFTILNAVFAYMSFPGLFFILPAACAVYSANNWKIAVTGRGFW